MKNRLFVGGLAWAANDQDLREAFAEFGTVTDSKVVLDRETGRSRGFGFVTFEAEEQAAAAVEAMEGKQLGGRSVTVKLAEERRPRLPRGLSGGGGYTEERRGRRTMMESPSGPTPPAPGPRTFDRGPGQDRAPGQDRQPPRDRGPSGGGYGHQGGGDGPRGGGYGGGGGYQGGGGGGYQGGGGGGYRGGGGGGYQGGGGGGYQGGGGGGYQGGGGGWGDSGDEGKPGRNARGKKRGKGKKPKKEW
jgi:heterogeneous nuclear ribonucleoprotein A1/A3